MIRQQSFRTRLLKLFFSLTGISFVLILIFIYFYFRNKERIYEISEDLSALTIHLIMDIKSQSDFIKYDAVDTTFFITGTTKNLETHRKISRNISNLLNGLNDGNHYLLRKLEPGIDSIGLFVGLINDQFDNIVEQIRNRGFKDYGTEGMMRDYAHLLEQTNINTSLLLSLRRHEKDYIIRKDPQYIEKFNESGAEFRKFLNYPSGAALNNKDSIEEILNKYILGFNNLVTLEKEIGLYENHGTMQELERLFVLTEQKIQNLNNEIIIAKSLIFKRFEIKSAIFFTFILLLNIIGSFVLSKKITYPLLNLSEHISSLTRRNFSAGPLSLPPKSDSEVAILYSEFNNMIDQLNFRENERDAALSALSENETRFRNLADLLPLGVFETDKNYKLIYLNKKAETTLGRKQNGIRNVHYLNEIINFEGRSTIDECNPSGSEFTAYKADGTEIPVLVYVSHIIKDNIFMGLRGIILDITERNRYIEELKEQKIKAEQADKLKSSFLANMSHEIRTPLNSIVGFSELLSQPGLDQKTRVDFAGYIRKSSDMLIKILGDLLDIAKIESGQLKISVEEFNINDLMDKITLQAAEQKKIENKDHLEIVMRKPENSNNITVKTDPHRLEQVLMNLINNAIKFTDRGFVEIGYSIKDTNTFCLYVKDTGVGINPENFERIFDRFIQIEDVNTKTHNGTGLGLSICKSITELLGGRIAVDSEPGSGSTFSISIPLIINNYYNINKSVKGIRVEKTSLSGKKILVAEDVDHNFILVREAFKIYNIDTIRAINGYEAINIIKAQNDIDLILMDMRMPIMDGYEAVARIRTINSTIPIIAVTAYAMQGEEEKCIRAGCNDYISKPVNMETLILKTTELISKTSSDCYELENLKTEKST